MSFIVYGVRILGLQLLDLLGRFDVALLEKVRQSMRFQKPCAILSFFSLLPVCCSRCELSALPAAMIPWYDELLSLLSQKPK